MKAFAVFAAALANPLTLRLSVHVNPVYYHTTISVGTPPQRQSFLVDTGGFSTTLTCKLSDSRLAFFYRVFAEKNSKTFRSLKVGERFDNWLCKSSTQLQTEASDDCLSQVSFGDGSVLTGKKAIDIFQIGHGDRVESFKRLFDCIEKQENFPLKDRCNGVLGLRSNYPNGSRMPAAVTTFLADRRQMFSICMAHYRGWLTFGGTHSQLHTTDAARRIVIGPPSDPNVRFENFNVSEILVEGKRVAVFDAEQSDALTFFDSGSSQLLLPPTTFEAFKKAFDDFCVEERANCGGYTALKRNYIVGKKKSYTKIANTFPLLTFVINGTHKYNILPFDYIRPLRDEKQKFNGIIELGFGTHSKMILGAPAMVGRDFAFDIQNRQIVVARADCSRNAFPQNRQTTQF